jgi:(5-formylfuran-3-yl)methyl phosphate synthase
VARLLVSVRSAEEARAALGAGASVIDVKEPRRGPLGRADVSVWSQVRQSVPPGTTLSVALGELRDWREDALDPASFQGFSYRKLGLAGSGPGWSAAWKRLTQGEGTGPSWIAVIYADWERAEAPDPESILDVALASDHCSGVLVDTWDKARPSPVDLSWRPLFDRVWLAGKLSALAGRLDFEAIDRLGSLRPDLIAVRGAACQGGDRSAAIDPARVSALSTLAAQI